MRVDAEFASLIPPLSPDERTGLEASIDAEGCRDPLVVWVEEEVLLDGHNRIEICKRLGKPYNTKGLSFESRDAAKTWIIRNQFARRNLNNWQRTELALKLEPLLKAQARKRQRAGGVDKVKQSSAEPQVDEQLGELAGVSRDTVQKVRVIYEQADPDLLARLRTDEVSINRATMEIRKRKVHAERERLHAEIRNSPPPLPEGPFRVIATDPPWPYESTYDPQNRRVGLKYPDMTLDEIYNLPVSKLAHEDAVLWLWTTNAFMGEAYVCLGRWGFTPKTIVTWDKVNFGNGFLLRGVTEHCILATRGHPPLAPPGNRSTIIREARRAHSRKPEAFYDLVEAICPTEPGGKLEMFAREQRGGWVPWGNEAPAEGVA